MRGSPRPGRPYRLRAVSPSGIRVSVRKPVIACRAAAGISGGYGPGGRAMAMALYFGGQMSSPKIRDYFQRMDIPVALSALEGWLVNDPERFPRKRTRCMKPGCTVVPGSTWMIP